MQKRRCRADGGGFETPPLLHTGCDREGKVVTYSTSAEIRSFRSTENEYQVPATSPRSLRNVCRQCDDFTEKYINYRPFGSRTPGQAAMKFRFFFFTRIPAFPNTFFFFGGVVHCCSNGYEISALQFRFCANKLHCLFCCALISSRKF